MRKNFLRRYFRNLVQNTCKSSNKKKNVFEIITYKQNIEKLKVIESLKHYTFSLRKKKTLKKYRALRKWGQNASSKVFFALKAYKNQKQLKRQIYDKVLEDRNRVVKQQLLFKIMKVGQYWVAKKDAITSNEAHMQKSFNLLYLNSKTARSPYNSVINTLMNAIAPREEVVKKEAMRPPKPPQAPKENIMDWLNNF